MLNELTAMDDDTNKVLSYQEEKDAGIRREDGAKNLATLKPVHLEMIEMHLHGWKNRDIAEAFSTTDSRVSILFHDPLAESIIAGARKDSEKRLSALHEKAVDVISDAMDTEKTIDDRLKGANLYFKENGKRSDDGAETAEDIVQKILNMQINGDVHIHSGGG